MRLLKKTPTANRSWFNDPKVRGWIFQIVAVLAVIALGWFLFHNTQSNLAQRGILSGFAFLDNTAGFGIAQSLIEYQESDSYGRVFLVGLLNTLLVSAIGIVLATLLGFVIGVARLSSNWLVSKLASVYIEIFRNIPPLLQIFFWYFAIFLSLPGPRQSMNLADSIFLSNRGLKIPAPMWADGAAAFVAVSAVSLVAVLVLTLWARRRLLSTGKNFPTLSVAIAVLILLPGMSIVLFGQPLSWLAPELKGFNFQGGWTLSPELMALTLALTAYTAAFIAENVRSGIQAVSHGQTEAARSLGLSEAKALRLVVIPQALRVIIPPLTSQYLNLTKNSSLAAAIGYPEMVSLFAGTTLNQTGQAIETIAITMSVYLIISISISLLMNWYNARMALVER